LTFGIERCDIDDGRSIECCDLVVGKRSNHDQTRRRLVVVGEFFAKKIKGSSELLLRLFLPPTQLNFTSTSTSTPHYTTSALTMSLLEVNTVDRLDRPSAYYAGKVRIPSLIPPMA
jgi:hypothetical protein